MYAARCRKSTGFSSERNTFSDTAPGVPVAAESTSLMARLLPIAVHNQLELRSLRSLLKVPPGLATARIMIGGPAACHQQACAHHRLLAAATPACERSALRYVRERSAV